MGRRRNRRLCEGMGYAMRGRRADLWPVSVRVKHIRVAVGGSKRIGLCDRHRVRIVPMANMDRQTERINI